MMNDEQPLAELYATMRALHERLSALPYVRADTCKAGDTVLCISWPNHIEKVTTNYIHVVSLVRDAKNKWPRHYPVTLVRVITPEDAQYIVDDVKAWYLYCNSVDLAEFVEFWRSRKGA